MNDLKSVYQGQLQAPPSHMANNTFARVLQDLSNSKYESEKTLAILDSFFSKYRLNSSDFPIMRNSYTRTALLQEDSGFEIMMARWEKGSTTPIHGHPSYSFIYLIEGQLSERFYVRDEKRLLEINTLNYSVGDYSYHNGNPGTFDNAIHKIRALQNSLSLHIYSDDALKGEVFNVS